MEADSELTTYWRIRKTLHRSRKKFARKLESFKDSAAKVEQPKVKPASSKKSFLECNRDFAKILRSQEPSGSLQSLIQAYFAIFDDSEHPLHTQLVSGRKHWYDKTFQLNDIALQCGRSAISIGDLKSARIIASFIHRTGFQGPATMLFCAQSAAASGEWGSAIDFYKKSKRPRRKLVPSSLRWEHQEQKFHSIKCMLHDIGVHWIDLNPVRPTTQRFLALQQWWCSLISTGQFEREELGPVLREIAELRKSRIDEGPQARLAADVSMMSIENFRNYLAGKTVCLVANSSLLLKHELGEKIDNYDVVVRFNSFVIDPLHTGRRTNVHAAVHLYEYNLDVLVDVRILVSGKKELWQKSVHEKIRPNKQKFLGDASLHWPAQSLGLLKSRGAITTPTVGFNMLRLIDHLDVSPVIDLIGFDFYSSGMYRVDEAMEVPHSAAHNSQAEKEWVFSNARSITDTVISMR